MSTVSIRLSHDLDLILNREAERTRRPKSEIARDAIADYLTRMERERFLADIARAARDRGDAEPLAFAAEALWTDNEALESAEPAAAVREPRAKHTARRKKR
jgi:predicted transcriptional regulator